MQGQEDSVLVRNDKILHRQGTILLCKVIFPEGQIRRLTKRRLLIEPLQVL